MNGAGLPASPFQADVPKEIPVSLAGPAKTRPHARTDEVPGSDALGRAQARGAVERKAPLARFPVK